MDVNYIMHELSRFTYRIMSQNLVSYSHRDICYQKELVPWLSLSRYPVSRPYRGITATPKSRGDVLCDMKEFL